MTLLYIEDRDSDARLFVYLLEVAAKTRAIPFEIRRLKALPSLSELDLCDLILLDTKLNGDAEVTFSWLHSLPVTAPPVFMLSGHPDYEKACLNAGAVGFMDKNKVVQNALVLIDQIQTVLTSKSNDI